ncbi:hypothetical protein SETIT_9G179500v2 [Setaria italica]|uniref:MADS-box domain-containing protein n=2 Tax=Setaria italica TaxID=4555 RepID=A0A368SHS9_SETIT|nr:uncharacterized protein LOC101770299 [Setaria italica]RCV41999.1 hypothetical protein SETIT_9G179500v2 [Setaria italica]
MGSDEAILRKNGQAPISKLGESQPEVWPGAPKVAEVLARFKAMPELDQCKKMMDMEGFLNQRIEKLREQLHKAQRENRERETTILLHDAVAGRRPAGLAGLSVEEIASLGWMVENRIHGVRTAIERLHGQGQDGPAAATLQLQLPQVTGLPLVPYGGGGIGPPAPGSRDVMMQAPPHQQAAWLMDVAKAGGDLGALAYSGFGGGRGSFVGGAGTSAAGADMLPPQLGNMGAGFAWADPAGLSFPPPM